MDTFDDLVPAPTWDEVAKMYDATIPAPHWGTYDVTAAANVMHAAHDLCLWDHSVLAEDLSDDEYQTVLVAVLDAQPGGPAAVARAVHDALTGFALSGGWFEYLEWGRAVARGDE